MQIYLDFENINLICIYKVHIVLFENLRKTCIKCVEYFHVVTDYHNNKYCLRYNISSLLNIAHRTLGRKHTTMTATTTITTKATKQLWIHVLLMFAIETLWVVSYLIFLLLSKRIVAEIDLIFQSLWNPRKLRSGYNICFPVPLMIGNIKITTIDFIFLSLIVIEWKPELIINLASLCDNNPHKMSKLIVQKLHCFHTW